MQTLKNPETFTLDLQSATPWMHPYNVTTEQQLFAAQRVGGFLSTQLERERNSEYDTAIGDFLPTITEPTLTGIEISYASLDRVLTVIDQLKTRIALAAAESCGNPSKEPLADAGQFA